MMNYTVKFINGNEAINGDHYTFNEEAKIFKANYVDLIIDFSNYNDITFDIHSNSVLNCGNNCTIDCGKYNEFYLGENCLVKDCYRDNIIHSCKPNCKVELYDGDYELINELINEFYIPTNYSIKTNRSKLGFEIVK